ncbi:MAG: Asd/ArgC dimerization domain-containing protein, partial [Gammaproteobacteria bacterium]|nr:Asd/ArgC dimerization domain-containing protein [Gammaproteobacteria bacterium]
MSEEHQHDLTGDSRPTVGIVGGAGYTGQELVGLLGAHGGVELAFATSRSLAGESLPGLGIGFVDPGDAPAGDVDFLFLCVPHGEAARWVARYAGGPRIIDLTDDHRPGSGREADAVYGLAERYPAEIAGAKLVANPGCYPTGVLLALLPLADAGLIDTGRLTVVNAASGVTGAGRTPKTYLLFAEVAEDYRAYGEGNRHRHMKELRALLPGIKLLFQPHLLPVARGILETIVLPVADSADGAEVRRAWREAYRNSRVVEVLDDGLPGLSRVVRTDRLVLGVTDVSDAGQRVVTVVGGRGNQGKGAAGPALPNKNLMWGGGGGRGGG